MEIAEAPLAHGREVHIDGPGGPIALTPLHQDHGGTPSLGFRIGDIAYNNDVVRLPEETMAALEGLDLWIVDALRYSPHPTHAHLERTLDWVKRLRPRRTILTNLHVDMDYETLRRELPGEVEPAYDGMSIDSWT
jgi:phosphoribosyl 1,2-cyclic phosphate phosphodiesterase